MLNSDAVAATATDSPPIVSSERDLRRRRLFRMISKKFMLGPTAIGTRPGGDADYGTMAGKSLSQKGRRGAQDAAAISFVIGGKRMAGQTARRLFSLRKMGMGKPLLLIAAAGVDYTDRLAIM